jgi:hypothetical protein
LVVGRWCRRWRKQKKRQVRGVCASATSAAGTQAGEEGSWQHQLARRSISSTS